MRASVGRQCRAEQKVDQVEVAECRPAVPAVAGPSTGSPWGARRRWAGGMTSPAQVSPGIRSGSSPARTRDRLLPPRRSRSPGCRQRRPPPGNRGAAVRGRPDSPGRRQSTAPVCPTSHGAGQGRPGSTCCRSASGACRARRTGRPCPARTHCTDRKGDSTPCRPCRAGAETA